MIIFGTRSSTIGTVDIHGTNCTHCGTNDLKRITVFGRYFHIFWIPVFPLWKSVVMECSHCLKTTRKREFTTEQTIQYQNAKHKVKRPIWHWTGSILIALFVGLIFAIAVFSPSSSSEEKDPRGAMLSADQHQWSATPTMASDAIAYHIEQTIESEIETDIDLNEIKYMTRIQNENLLVLLKVRELKKVDKENRPILIEVIEEYIQSQPELEQLNTYIGIHGKYNMMVIKTPTELHNSRFVSDRHLYDFYGPKPIQNKAIQDSLVNDTLQSTE